MSTHKTSHLAKQNYSVPEWMVRVQCILFGILWTVTMLPNLLMVQNFTLILGALIGIYVSIKNRKTLLSQKAIPLAIIVCLFLWVTLHLLIIGENHTLQWAEYKSLWKRAILGSVFALGLGISITESKKSHWATILGGFCGPMLIYYFKCLAGFAAIYYGFRLPEFLMLFSGGISPFYIPKISYVFYCLPLLAVSLGSLGGVLRSKNLDWRIASIYMTLIIGVLGIFYLENIKNGFVWTFILALIFLISLFWKGVKALSFKSYILLGIVCVTMLGAIFNNYRANYSWQSLPADLKVAIYAQPSEIWKENTSVYPLNENGQEVSHTNFDRIFYLKTAAIFLSQHPLGYGLVHSSFGHIARISFSNAPLIQSHSGWMDFALGLGIPGVAILLLASILTMFRATTIESPWGEFGFWSLLSLALIFLTTEVSQKNYIDTYIWFMILIASLGLKKPQIYLADFHLD